eukprot:g2763.t1
MTTHQLQPGAQTVSNTWTQFYAARHGKLSRMKALINREGYNPELTDEIYGRTSLHWACKNGHTELANLLISHGANVNPIDSGGCSPLHFAAGWGSRVLVGLLLSHSADHSIVNVKGQTALAVAKQMQRVENEGVLSRWEKSVDSMMNKTAVEEVLARSRFMKDLANEKVAGHEQMAELEAKADMCLLSDNDEKLEDEKYGATTAEDGYIDAARKAIEDAKRTDGYKAEQELSLVPRVTAIKMSDSAVTEAEEAAKLARSEAERAQVEAAEATAKSTAATVMRLKKTLHMKEQMLGSHHIGVAVTLQKLAALLKRENYLEEAANMLHRAAEITEANRGSDHVDTAATLNNLGEVYYCLGKKLDALDAFQRAVNILSEHYRKGLLSTEPVMSGGSRGANVIDFSTTLRNRSLALLAQEPPQLEKALISASRSVELIEEVRGNESVAVARGLELVGYLHLLLEETDSAVAVFKRCITIGEKRHGSRDIYDPVSALEQLANVHYSARRLQEAYKYFTDAFRTRQRICGDNHPDTIRAAKNLAVVQAQIVRDRAAALKKEKKIKKAARLLQKKKKKKKKDARVAAAFGGLVPTQLRENK